MVSNDLFIGRQFTRPKHPVAEPVAPVSAEQIASPRINETTEAAKLGLP